MAVCSGRDIAELLIKCDVGGDRWPYGKRLSGYGLRFWPARIFNTGHGAAFYCRNRAHIAAKRDCCVPPYSLEQGEKKMNIWRGHSGTYLTCRDTPQDLAALLNKAGLTILEHSDPFRMRIP